MKRTCLLVLVLLMVMPTTVPGQSPNRGDKFVSQCGETVRSIDGQIPEDIHSLGSAFYCLGVVRGVWNMAEDFLATVCTPETVELAQVVGVVAAHLTEHPEDLHLPDTDLVLIALQDAYPCPVTSRHGARP